MKPLLKIILFQLIAMTLLSCRDVFYPDEIDARNKIPVIIGKIIVDKPPEVSVTLASIYLDRPVGYEKNANVWITDDSGTSEELAFDGKTHYRPINEDFTGINGRTYILHVMMPDGNLYESAPERIRRAADRHAITASAVDRKRIYETSLGTFFTKHETGIDVSLSLEVFSDSTGYFRFETDVLTQFTYAVLDTLNPDTLIIGYAWTSSNLGNFYDVKFSYQGSAVQVIPEYKVGFLEFIYNPLLGSELRSPPVIYAWAISVHVFSISANTYLYYNSVRQQLDSDNALFGPVPGQLKSNLHCTTNPENEVLGIFEAASESVYNKAFHWIDKGIFESRDLESFPEDAGEGQSEGSPPDFWISF
jgi:hypothetical protein